MIIKLSGDTEFRIRSIDEGDIEELRQWKNLNRESFFLKEEITSEQQSAWFASFCERDDDRMFVVEQEVGEDFQKIGCMGFRRLQDDGCVDAYNIIRSKKIEPAGFVFADPFRLMLAYAAGIFPDLPIRCNVLSQNPAVKWYERNGFSKLKDQGSYFLMELDQGTISDVQFLVNETI